MIEPAVTSWPAKTLTPRRCACESRPFLEEPSPFLCAICVLLRGRLSLLARGARLLRSADRGDRDPRQLRAVAARLLETALWLVGEDTDLVAADVLEHLGGDRAGKLRAVGDDAVAPGHEHLGGERRAGIQGLAVDQELLALLDAVLLAANLDHCVHTGALHTKMPAVGRAG